MQRIPSLRHRLAVRAAALAAWKVIEKAKRYNPNNPGAILGSVLNILYALIRRADVRHVPVPKSLNRSAISRAEANFWKQFEKEYPRLERQAAAKRKPCQPKLITRAMAMLPSARGGKGPEKFAEFVHKMPQHLRPIHELMSRSIELILLRDRWLRRPKPGKKKEE